MTNLPALIPHEHEMMVFDAMASQAVNSKMYKGIGDKAGIMMIMLSARELGIPAMQALNGGLNIINGKVEISARMMNALIRRAGHSIVIKESTEKACILTGKRIDNGDSATASFTYDDAVKAGLIKSGGGWTKFPKDMLFARALSRLARQLFSDVIGIGYVEGEIKASEVEIITPEPELTYFDEEQGLREAYLKLFEPEDEALALNYLDVVKNHFEWSFVTALTELLKDQAKTLEKFHQWKSKYVKVEVDA